MPLHLKNPHSVLAALDVRPNDVLSVRLAGGKPSGAWADAARRAEAAGVAVARGGGDRPSGRRRRNDAAGGRTGATEAVVRERGPSSLDALFDSASGERPGLWLALDQLQDPHNVGAIFRTAAFFGVRGVVLTKDRSAPLNETVYDVASGGIEYTPFAVETNLSRTLDAAKDAGLWVLGASEHGDEDFFNVPRDRPWLLVIGNEEKGMRRLTQEKCDVVCRLDAQSPVTSLNASVAAGVMIAGLTQNNEWLGQVKSG